MGIKLSLLALVLGAVAVLKSVWGLWKPQQFSAAFRKFPRSLPWGYLLIAVATFWFLYNVNQETVADFATMKKVMGVSFALIGLATCLFVKDFLAVRGLALVLLLLAKLTVDSARWVESDWRLVLVVLAYFWVIVGMWFTISPWHFRDLIYWKTASEKRIRISSGFSLIFGVLLILLGATVF